ncbi:MAG: HAMP domain-containing sensor histidine kinase [Chloroflexi bacterium]|nr:HAMP domain-containing sensor histidine kinase [Chloroflexota bacterium]
MRLPAFTKTIRFKLTLLYSVLLLLFGALFLVGLNVAMHQSLSVAKVPEGPRTSLEIVKMVSNSNLELLRNYSIIGLAGFLLLGAVGGYFFSRRMLQPVHRITSLAASIQSTNLKERISHQGPDDELKRLADTFDDMLDRLENAFRQQKQFIQDASHELRTPLAVAMTNIEVIEMDEGATKRDYERLIGLLKPTLDRMSKLSDDLLLLSEGGQNQTQWSVVDMSSVVGDVAKEANAEATAAGLILLAEPTPEGALVLGDSLLLRQAVANLVDNAIKYSRPGGEVKVSARTEDSKVVVRVKDNGIGISETDRQHIFDRFYRVDKSRSRAHGGSGLGLAIVKRIVEDHQSSVFVESVLGEGSTFEIVLPQYKTAEPDNNDPAAP